MLITCIITIIAVIKMSSHFTKAQIIEQFEEYKKRAQLKISTLTKINESLQDESDFALKIAEKDCEDVKKRLHSEYQQFRTLYKNEFETLKQKLNLYENKEELLREQILILKKEIRSKQEIIDAQNKQFEQQKALIANPINKSSADIKIIQELELYKSENIRNLSKIQDLQTQINALHKKLETHQNQSKTIQQQISYANTQTHYYKSQNQQLQQQIRTLKNKITELQQNTDRAIQEENNKWWKINENLLNRVKVLENQSSEHEKKYYQLFKEHEKMKEMLEKEKSNSKNYLVEIGWYKELLEEAKGQFICNELSKQNITAKLQQQRNTLAKENKKLKEQLGGGRHKQNKSTVNHKTSKLLKVLQNNKSKSPFRVNHNISNISISDFDKEMAKGSNKSPDKIGSLPSTSKANKSKVKETPKK